MTSCGAAAQAPTSSASPTPWPSCCSVVTWTQFPPSCLLPSLGSAPGLPCQFPKASPPGSLLCPPHPQVSYPYLEHSGSSPFSPTHRESFGPSAHFPFGSWLNIGSPWPDCEFSSPRRLSHLVLPSPPTVPGREEPRARGAPALGTEPWCSEA